MGEGGGAAPSNPNKRKKSDTKKDDKPPRRQSVTMTSTELQDLLSPSTSKQAEAKGEGGMMRARTQEEVQADEANEAAHQAKARKLANRLAAEEKSMTGGVIESKRSSPPQQEDDHVKPPAKRKPLPPPSKQWGRSIAGKQTSSTTASSTITKPAPSPKLKETSPTKGNGQWYLVEKGGRTTPIDRPITSPMTNTDHDIITRDITIHQTQVQEDGEDPDAGLVDYEDEEDDDGIDINFMGTPEEVENPPERQAAPQVAKTSGQATAPRPKSPPRSPARRRGYQARKARIQQYLKDQKRKGVKCPEALVRYTKEEAGHDQVAQVTDMIIGSRTVEDIINFMSLDYGRNKIRTPPRHLRRSRSRDRRPSRSPSLPRKSRGHRSRSRDRRSSPSPSPPRRGRNHRARSRERNQPHDRSQPERKEVKHRPNDKNRGERRRTPSPKGRHQPPPTSTPSPPSKSTLGRRDRSDDHVVEANKKARGTDITQNAVQEIQHQLDTINTQMATIIQHQDHQQQLALSLARMQETIKELTRMAHQASSVHITNTNSISSDLEAALDTTLTVIKGLVSTQSVGQTSPMHRLARRIMNTIDGHDDGSHDDDGHDDGSHDDDGHDDGSHDGDDRDAGSHADEGHDEESHGDQEAADGDIPEEEDGSDSDDEDRDNPDDDAHEGAGVDSMGDHRKVKEGQRKVKNSKSNFCEGNAHNSVNSASMSHHHAHKHSPDRKAHTNTTADDQEQDQGIMTTTELAQFVRATFSGRDLRKVIIGMSQDAPNTIMEYEALQVLVLTRFDESVTAFEEVWDAMITLLDDATEGKGLLRGGAPAGEGVMVPRRNHNPGTMSLLDQIADPDTLNLLSTLPQDALSTAACAIYCKFLGHDPTHLVPRVEDYEGAEVEGTPDYKTAKRRRLELVRDLHLKLSKEVRDSLEKPVKKSAALRAANLQPPKFNGSEAYPPFRRYLNSVEEFANATEDVGMGGIFTQIIPYVEDEATRRWLSELRDSGKIEDMEDLRQAFEERYNHGRVYDSYINSLIHHHKPIEGETLLASGWRFINHLSDCLRPYLKHPPTPGSDAEILEEQDCNHFLSAQTAEDNEKLRQLMLVYQNTHPHLPRHLRLLEAVKAYSASKQSINGVPYVPTRKKKTPVPPASPSLPPPINNIDAHTEGQDHLAKAINALNSRIDKLAHYQPDKSHDKPKRDDKSKPTWKNGDRVALSELEDVRKKQMDATTHTPYYKLTIKETNARLCTLCAGEDHLFP